MADAGDEVGDEAFIRPATDDTPEDLRANIVKGFTIFRSRANSVQNTVGDKGQLSLVDKSLFLNCLSATTIPLSLQCFISIFPLREVVLNDIMDLMHLDMSMISGCANLYLFVCNNCKDLRVVTWHENEGGCKLSCIDFEHNPWLSKLPLPIFAGISTLSELKCQGCPRLVSPPVEVANQGARETVHFLRDVAARGVFSTDMTLFLLGDGEAGKTSVFRALKSPGNVAEVIREDHRTVGIDKEEWRPSADLDLRFRVMDLAGQAVYESTHQYFLQRRAVYLLVWRAYPVQDGRLNVLTDRIRHWLEALQMRAPGSHVMLVVTHIDAVEAAALDEQCWCVKDAVRRSLDDIRQWSGDDIMVHAAGESQRVNCLMGHGVSQLRASVINFSLSMPFFKEALPLPWVQLRSEVERRIRAGQRFMGFEEWSKLAKSMELQGQLFRICTSFLHETGVVRCFGTLFNADSSHLGAFYNTVFFDVRWMIDVLKGLVRHDRHALQDFFSGVKMNKTMLRRVNRLNATARLHKDLLPFLWPSVASSSEFWDSARAGSEQERSLWSGGDVVTCEADIEKAVELLKGFDLVVQQRDEFLVPAILPPSKVQVSADAFSGSLCTCKVSFSYPKLPSSFFQRIVVRVAGQATTVEFSSSAAVFYLLGNVCTILVRTDERGQHLLDVSSTGREMLTMVEKEIGHVHAFYPGIRGIFVNKVKGKEPWQFCLISSDEQSRDVLKAPLKELFSSRGLRMTEHLMRDYAMSTNEELQQIRVVIAVISDGFGSSQADQELLSKINSRTAIIPVLVNSLDPELSWKGMVANHVNRPLDMRDHTKAWNTILAESKKLLEDENLAKIHARGCRAMCFRHHVLSDSEIEEQAKKATEVTWQTQRKHLKGALEANLLPRAMQLLDNWRADMSSLAATLSDDFDPSRINCKCGHFFKRTELANTAASAPATATVTCPQCSHAHLLLELLAIPEVRPCPICISKNQASPGVFSLSECNLQFAEGVQRLQMTLECKVCLKNGRQPKLHQFDIFPPDVVVLATDRELQETHSILRKVGTESGTVLWAGTSGYDNSLALQRCSVVILILSVDFTTDEGLKRELETVLASGKLVIPLVDLSTWTGPRDQQHYWKALTRAGGSSQVPITGFQKLERFVPVYLDLTNDKGADSMVQQLSALVSSRIHRAVNLRVFSQLPMRGIRLSGLVALVREWSHLHQIQSLTTAEIMVQFVKPGTERSRLSWCDQEENSESVHTAEWFVSHAWKYKFLDVVSALQRHFFGSDPVIWLDILSVSQHETNIERPYEWWNSAFLNAVGQMGRVVMVLDSWEEPTALTRAWCIFEVFACETTCSDFRIAMTKEVSRRFVEDMKLKESVAKMNRVMNSLKCEGADAQERQDRDNIFENIRRTVGFEKLNSMVASAVHRALCQQLAVSAGWPGQKCDIMLSLTAARVAWLKRQSSMPLPILEACLQHPRVRGDVGLHADVVLELAEILLHESVAEQSRAERLVQTEQAILASCSSQGFSANAISAACLLAWCASRRQDHRGDELWLRCVSRALEFKGMIGAALRLLCNQLVGLGRTRDAQALIDKELTSAEDALGAFHPFALDCLELQASTMAVGSEAEAVLRKCLAGRERVLGFTHVETVKTRDMLARMNK